MSEQKLTRAQKIISFVMSCVFAGLLSAGVCWFAIWIESDNLIPWFRPAMIILWKISLTILGMIAALGTLVTLFVSKTKEDILPRNEV